MATSRFINEDPIAINYGQLPSWMWNTQPIDLNTAIQSEAKTDYASAQAQKAQDEIDMQKEFANALQGYDGSLDDKMPEVRKILASHGNLDALFKLDKESESKKKEAEQKDWTMLKNLQGLDPDVAKSYWDANLASTYGPLESSSFENTKLERTAGGGTVMLDADGNILKTILPDKPEKEPKQPKEPDIMGYLNGKPTLVKKDKQSVDDFVAQGGTFDKPQKMDPFMEAMYMKMAESDPQFAAILKRTMPNLNFSSQNQSVDPALQSSSPLGYGLIQGAAGPTPTPAPGMNVVGTLRRR